MPAPSICAAVLDVILSWKARESMSFYVKLRYILKVVSAAAWVIILPVTYAYTWENPPGFAQTIKSWFGKSSHSPSLFVLAVVVYLSPNMLAAVLFLFPLIRRFLERSNYKIVMLMMWWSQVSTLFLLSLVYFYLLMKLPKLCYILNSDSSVSFCLQHILSTSWYFAASTLCWEGNAWECIFSFQVRRHCFNKWMKLLVLLTLLFFFIGYNSPLFYFYFILV